MSRSVAAVIEPVGTLFVNAIRMTVIPLVVSSLIVGIATSGSGASVAKIGGRGVVVLLVLLAASGVVGALIAPPVLSRVNVDPAAVASLRASAGSSIDAVSGNAIQTPVQWLVSLVPSNPFTATAAGAVRPPIRFASA